MLTKEERAAIAGRLKKCTCMIADSAYKALFNKEVPSWTTWQQDSNDAINRILDLCDTSNMIELPLDKDGEVIRVGDVVYGEDGLRHEVYQIVFDGDTKWLVLARDGELSVGTYSSPISFTHKQPVTAKSLAQRIRDVLRNDHSEMSLYTSRELVHIANDLERLGDNNE